MQTAIEPLSAAIEHCDYVTLISSDQLDPEVEGGVANAIPLLQVSSPKCQALIAPQGAQLLSHRPQGGRDILWLSPKAVFASGKAIRGGIPLCLPWFGQHTDSDKPQHGFARTESWQLQHASHNSQGQVQLKWAFNHYCGEPHPMFPWRFKAQLGMTLERDIKLALTVTNLDSHPMPLSWAMHSYHPVETISRVRISGLSDCDYLDNTQALERFSQSGDVVFNGELDRIYLSVPRTQIIHSQSELHISGTHCHSAIVWNPGPTKAAAMIDIGAENYASFVCLERGNTADNALTLAPGDSHHASVDISLSDA